MPHKPCTKRRLTKFSSKRTASWAVHNLTQSTQNSGGVFETSGLFRWPQIQHAGRATFNVKPMVTSLVWQCESCRHTSHCPRTCDLSLSQVLYIILRQDGQCLPSQSKNTVTGLHSIQFLYQKRQTKKGQMSLVQTPSLRQRLLKSFHRPTTLKPHRRWETVYFFLPTAVSTPLR